MTVYTKQYPHANAEVREAATLCIFLHDVDQKKVLAKDETLNYLNLYASYLATWREDRSRVT